MDIFKPGSKATIAKSTKIGNMMLYAGEPVRIVRRDGSNYIVTGHKINDLSVPKGLLLSAESVVTNEQIIGEFIMMNEDSNSVYSIEFPSKYRSSDNSTVIDKIQKHPQISKSNKKAWEKAGKLFLKGWDNPNIIKKMLSLFGIKSDIDQVKIIEEDK